MQVWNCLVLPLPCLNPQVRACDPLERGPLLSDHATTQLWQTRCRKQLSVWRKMKSFSFFLSCFATLSSTARGKTNIGEPAQASGRRTPISRAPACKVWNKWKTSSFRLTETLRKWQKPESEPRQVAISTVFFYLKLQCNWMFNLIMLDIRSRKEFGR